MNIKRATKEEMGNWGYGIVSFMEDVDVLIVDGVIVKNRIGKVGAEIGDSLYIHEEREEDRVGNSRQRCD